MGPLAPLYPARLRPEAYPDDQEEYDPMKSDGAGSVARSGIPASRRLDGLIEHRASPRG